MNKILVLGVDGMDPRLATKFVEKGSMPNLKKMLLKGSRTKDLTMLGALPTITPPLWTTLATGSYPGTHGITCFWNQSHESLDTLTYSMDSRLCKSEPIWNVLAEEGHKTLVWHWPGSSWPPTSKSENLHVVDGTQPNTINAGCAGLDSDKMIIASKDIQILSFGKMDSVDTGAGCVLTGLEQASDSVDEKVLSAVTGSIKETKNLILRHEDGDGVLNIVSFDQVNSPLLPASGWCFPTDDALEFYLLTSGGMVRRPALLKKNETGIYDSVAIYRSKKEVKPIVILKEDAIAKNVIDEVYVNDEYKMANRHMRLIEIAPDGSKVEVWLGTALDYTNNTVWHPKALFEEITEQVGIVSSITLLGSKDTRVVEKVILPAWDIYVDWQATCLKYLIKNHDYDVIFSHLHNVDNCGHAFWELTKEAEHGLLYQGYLEDVYKQTDRYFGNFLDLLEENWTIFIVSDHGLLILPEEEPPLIGDGFGFNIGVMKELGYTVLKKNAQGEEYPEIDWEKTRAVAPRTCHIWINSVGKYATGIVPESEKYELERQIISDLYNYRLNGKRVISLALRNKDAKLLGLFGNECGDIVYFLEEGFNRAHGDSLSTHMGNFDTSVSPIFVAAGSGIKENYICSRIIRQVDITPTIATLAGVRMPTECEGAPIYQILK